MKAILWSLLLTSPVMASSTGPLDSARLREISHAQSAPVIVAVIDTGLDLKNPHFKEKVWTNPGEIPGNGLDDDRNGFIDDEHGWDFSNQDPNPDDSHGHGTHVSGLILSLAPNVQLMPLKYYDLRNSKTNTLETTVAALRYAIKMKVDVINYSGGGAQRSREEEKAIEDARDQGILVVAAAGNEGTSLEFTRFFPASYGLSNILSVTATDDYGVMIPTSNYSSFAVEIAAPGKDLNSTIPGNKWGRMTGTSQATALASGAAAQLLHQRPQLKGQPVLVKETLLAGARPNPQLHGKVKNELQLDSASPSYMYSSQQTPFEDLLAEPLDFDFIKNMSDKL